MKGAALLRGSILGVGLLIAGVVMVGGAQASGTSAHGGSAAGTATAGASQTQAVSVPIVPVVTTEQAGRGTRHLADLPGWADDDHGAALAVFRATCGRMKGAEWQRVCTAAQHDSDARRFFEDHFTPVPVGERPVLFTAYYEPELPGSTVRTARFAWPVYARPPEFDGKGRWHSRAEIEERGLLHGRGLELAWLEDPVTAFFLQVQGSGRIRLPDGQVLRLGFAAKNNHPFRSVGREMVRRGLLAEHAASARRIRDWVRQNPAEGLRLLRHNPSYVFFRRLTDLPPERGPIGAMGHSVTVLRSLAVDPAVVPLGAPVWIDKGGAQPLQRLMVAQDTGTAIKGPQRADIFHGSGAAAGKAASRTRDEGRMMVLRPRATVTASTGG